MGYFLITALYFTAISLLVGLIGTAIFLCYLPFRKRLLKSGKLTSVNNRRINRLYIILLLIIPICSTYFVFFPTDSFYKDEFKNNSGFELPNSADIIHKSYGIPDFHGDYEASAMIKLEKNDFINLKMQLSKNTNFQPDTSSQPIGVTQSYFTVSKNIKKNQIEVVLEHLKEEWFRVAFLKDGQTILFEKCSS